MPRLLSALPRHPVQAPHHLRRAVVVEVEAEEPSSLIRWRHLQHCCCGDKRDHGAMTPGAPPLEGDFTSARADERGDLLAAIRGVTCAMVIALAFTPARNRNPRQSRLWLAASANGRPRAIPADGSLWG